MGRRATAARRSTASQPLNHSRRPEPVQLSLHARQALGAIKDEDSLTGSPALRGRRFCFFHKNWQGQRIQLNAKLAENFSFPLPVLEDADSVQVALIQVMRLILSGQLEPRTAGLLLYALQTASLNLRQMKLEPRNRETVIIDPGTVADNGVGDELWQASDFEEEDDEDDEYDEEDEYDEDDEDDEDDEEETPKKKSLRK